MRIQAVTFDVGGTLIEPWPSVGHVYAEVAAENGVRNFTPDLLNRRFFQAWSAKSQFDYSRKAWSSLVSKTFSLPGREIAEIPFFDQLYERFAHREAWRIFYDVLPTLELLSERGVKLGIISNWDERLRPLLRELKLDRYFQFLAISSEIGFHKPSPVIFEEAIRRLGVAPHEALHVGDSDNEDFAGARTAGLQAMLVTREGGIESHGALASLMSLESLLD
jgi:putative hydrolase of the HAD superfamily